MYKATSIHRAVLSVTNKLNIERLGHFLSQKGIEIVSTGGTGRKLTESGIVYRPVQEITGVPEMLDGRVKTLHPKLLGGVLYRRLVPEHAQAVEEHGLCPIDLIVVNLYPFSETISKPGCTLNEAVEQIDIGGPTMLRAAAKNHGDVTVVVDPLDYDELMSEIDQYGGTTLNFRLRMAAKAFRHTSEYDKTIADFFDRIPLSST